MTVAAKYWGATMETNFGGTYHFHLVLQFKSAKGRRAASFALMARGRASSPATCWGKDDAAVNGGNL